MSRDTYDYRRRAISIAKQLNYGIETIVRLKNATTDCEIARIMKTAREEV